MRSSPVSLSGNDDLPSTPTPGVESAGRPEGATAAVVATDPAFAHHADALKVQMEKEFRETTAAQELRVALVGMILTSSASLISIIGHFLGSHVPLRVLFITLPLAAWYSFLVLLHARKHNYPRWMRYVSTTLEVSVASGLLLIDLVDVGPLYANSGAGPALYVVAVTAASLRLDSKLSLFSGVFGALQYFLLTSFVIRPALAKAGMPTYVADPVVVLVRSSFILAAGAFGDYSTRAARSLLFRLTNAAVQRDRLRGLFGMHVSEEVMKLLVAGGVPDGGERRAVTVCFTDIRGFTSLSETREPEELVRLLNLYFARMCEITSKHGGVVNKFLGDGMLIVFGAPTHLPDDARHAMAAAQEMLNESARMATHGEFPGLRIGVGLHRGVVVVGNIGGDQRREYTVIGDTVNTASRVQDLTKQLSHGLLFTREVLDALGQGTYESLGRHSVKGREAPLEIFTLAESSLQT